ncbi:hypothetical protein GGP50_002586 [Salinibacter ruber]|nr:hypothetical protein [Salinibacter ruber]
MQAAQYYATSSVEIQFRRNHVRSQSTRSRAQGRSEDRSGGSRGGSLRTYGDLQAGWASTFAGALEVSREAIIEAVGGPDATETFICLGGKRSSGGNRTSGGNRSSGGSQPADSSDKTLDRTPGGPSGRGSNRTEPEERDLASADRVFIAVTEEQFKTLAERVGAETNAR